MCWRVQLILEHYVPLILDGVVSATGQEVRNFGPTVLLPSVLNVENPILLIAPAKLFDQRIQLVDPSLTALFACATRNVDCKLLP